MPPELPYNTRGQLAEVILRDVSFRRNLDWEWPGEGISYAIDTRTEGVVLGNRDRCHAHLHVRIDFQREGEKIEAPFELKMVITGVFDWLAPELPDEEIEGWLSFNAEHLLWPYLRAFVSQITAAAGLPILTLYTISVPRPHLGQPDAVDASGDEQMEPSETGG